MVLGVCSCYDYLSTAIVETCTNSLLAWFNILLTDVQDNKASSPHLFQTLLYCTGHLATAISSSTLLQVTHTHTYIVYGHVWVCVVGFIWDAEFWPAGCNRHWSCSL